LGKSVISTEKLLSLPIFMFMIMLLHDSVYKQGSCKANKRDFVYTLLSPIVWHQSLRYFEVTA
jgi:hypothetical protein